MALPETPGQTPERMPRKEIPDAWAGSGRCPACAAAPLKVVHLPSPADYLICPVCELSFEVELNGGNIRIKNVPEQLGFAEGQLRYRWIKPSILRELLNNRRALIEKKAGNVATHTFSDDEVWNRMLSLYHLGNKPKMIELILIQAGATQEQAEAAFVRLKQRSEQDTRKQIQKFWLAGGIASFLAVVLLGGWAFTMSRINAQLEQGVANRGAASQPVAALQILNVLPDVIKPDFLKSPAVQVEHTGPKKAPCPASPAAAANLFGGEGWTQASQPEAWQMMNTGTPTTVRIPTDMVAGLIDNKSLEFSSVNGPATVHNVNFIVVMCS